MSKFTDLWLLYQILFIQWKHAWCQITGKSTDKQQFLMYCTWYLQPTRHFISWKLKGICISMLIAYKSPWCLYSHIEQQMPQWLPKVYNVHGLRLHWWLLNGTHYHYGSFFRSLHNTNVRDWYFRNLLKIFFTTSESWPIYVTPIHFKVPAPSLQLMYPSKLLLLLTIKHHSSTSISPN